VETKDLRDLVRFDDAGPHHEELWTSDELWSELVCLKGAQGIGPISDRDSDAVCTVIAGEVALQVDRGRKRLGQWESALVPKGSELTIRNASPEPSVVLIVAAPPPAPRPFVE
jgi:quercetin dioxygenase-like cupin family protein